MGLYQFLYAVIVFLLHSFHALRRLNSALDDLVKSASDLHRTNVAQALVERPGNSAFFATKLLEQHLSVDEFDHVVGGTVEDQYALTANRVAELLQLHGTLMMETGGGKLAQEALPREDAR